MAFELKAAIEELKRRVRDLEDVAHTPNELETSLGAYELGKITSRLDQIGRRLERLEAFAWLSATALNEINSAAAVDAFAAALEIADCERNSS